MFSRKTLTVQDRPEEIAAKQKLLGDLSHEFWQTKNVNTQAAISDAMDTVLNMSGKDAKVLADQPWSHKGRTAILDAMTEAKGYERETKRYHRARAIWGSIVLASAYSTCHGMAADKGGLAVISTMTFIGALYALAGCIGDYAATKANHHAYSAVLNIQTEKQPVVRNAFERFAPKALHPCTR